MIGLPQLKRQFQDFADQTRVSRKRSERDRDYRDHKQWTDSEIATLKGRNQQAVVVNKVKKKLDFLVGLEIRGRMAPKALPRTPKHERDSDAVTEALRYVDDNANLSAILTDCFDEYICEGHEALIVEVAGEKREIKPRRIPWDRFYYDPHSRERDFSDARYMGITTWIDRADLAHMFPKKRSKIMSMGATTAPEETMRDRPYWYDSNMDRKRVRFNEHYYIENGEWKLAIFSGGLMLVKPQASPFLDCDGVPTCPIIGQRCYIDRENDSYGVIRGDIDLQDQINRTRTKAMHMLSSQVVISDKGIVSDATHMMEGLRSGDAHIELLRTDARFDIDRNQELASGQVAMYQDAKAELDDTVVNSVNARSGESGRSKLVDRENDIDELASVFEGHRTFKLRVYRQVWASIKQFWTEERWVRVSDDDKGVKFVGLNRRVTGRDVIAERFGIQVGDVDQFLLQNGANLMPGQLDRVVRTDNQVSELDVDIIIRDIPDVVTIQQEQFEIISNLAQVYPQQVPFEAILRLSTLPNKDEIIEQLQGDDESREAAQAQQLQMQQAMAELEMQERQAGVADTLASARSKNSVADKNQIESQLALSGVERIG